MAWPKRGTRRIVVDGEAFAWHSGTIDCGDVVFTAGKPGVPYVLFIDPLPWPAPPPAHVAAAIRYARAQGWSAESGPTRAVAFSEATQTFEWLPEGHRHLAQRTPSPLSE